MVGFQDKCMKLLLCLVKKKKIKTTMISVFYNNYYLFENKEKVNVLGIFAKRILIRSISIRILNLINDLITSLYLFINKPTIVHETYYSEFLYKNNKSRYVTTVHDMIWEKFPKFFKYSELMIRAKKKSIDRADHIVCVSENTKKDLIEIYDVDEKKISVSYPGYFSTSKIKQYKIKKKKFFLEKEKFILYVGLRGTYKNFIFFLKCFVKSKAHKTHKIICFGGEHPSGEENKIINDNKINYVSGSDEDLANYYQHADFFIFPSIYEGFGVPPLEAMFFNCPVLCSNQSSLPEVVGDAALLFDPFDKKDLIEKINKITIDRGLRSKLILKGKKRVNLFSWKKCSKENYKIYKKTLN